MTQVSAQLDQPSTLDLSAVQTVDGIANPDLALLDINFRELRVPKVGQTRTDKRREVKIFVIGPDGTEVMWITRVCAALHGSGLAPATCSAYAQAFYRVAVVMWALDLDPQRLTVIQWVVIRSWLSHCLRRTVRISGDWSKPMSPSTAASTEAGLLTLYDKAVALGLAETNPIASLRGTPFVDIGEQRFDTRFGRQAGRRQHGKGTTFSVPTKQIKTVSEEDQERLRNATQTRDRALWTFCLDTGPRIAEALSVTPATYFPDENYALVIAKGRGGARRLIPVSDATVEAIDDYLATLARKGFRPGPTDCIFRSVYRPFAPFEAGGAWAALRRALGNPDIHPHALRHTAATQMLRLIDDPEGKGLTTVKVMLGHANVATTSKYLHLTNQEVISDVVAARHKPRQRSSALAGIYTSEHLSVLDAILQEAAE